jgi:hypothetical protein
MPFFNFGEVLCVSRPNRNLDCPGLRHRCGRCRPGAMRVIVRPNRNLDRAGLRHRCSRDHPVTMRAIARAKVVQENNALTDDRDDQGYNQGYCATPVHLRYLCYLTTAQVVCIAAFDDQLAFTMSGGAASVGSTSRTQVWTQTPRYRPQPSVTERLHRPARHATQNDQAVLVSTDPVVFQDRCGWPSCASKLSSGR